MSGYFMVRRKAIAGRTMNPLGYKILVEVLGRGEIRAIREVGYVFRERLEGESKVTGTLYVDYLRHLVRLRLSTLPLQRFGRFALVGLSGVLIDMGLLYMLADPHVLALSLTQSKVVAAEMAVINNFLWNDAWTFADLAKDQPGASQKAQRFLKFNAVCAVGILLNVVLLRILTGYFAINVYVANAIAIGVVTLWNFGLNVSLSWRASELRASSPPPLRLGEPKAAE
jgi:dolichol-phosphate mannosyltransferase